MNKRVIFFGTPSIAAQLLEAVTKQVGLEVVLVVTESDKPAGRGQKIASSPVKLFAQKHNIAVAEPKNKAELADIITKTPADLGILLAYGRIVPKEVISHFPYGILNLHPSLLPKYRGPAPVFWPILNGDTATGASIMLLDEGMDSGPLLGQLTETIKPEDTTESLTDRLVTKGIKYLLELIPQYLLGQLSPIPQAGEPTVTRKLSKVDGQIDWQQPANTIERQIRACLPWPRAYTIWKGQPLQILKASVTDGKLIPEEVQPAGRRAMTWLDFCRGQHLEPEDAIHKLTSGDLT